jgi:hypothetical protein
VDFESQSWIRNLRNRPSSWREMARIRACWVTHGAAVLRGMVKTMRELRPRIAVLETMQDHQQRAGSSVENINAVLSDLGYVPSPADSGVPSFFYNTVYVARELLSS